MMRIKSFFFVILACFLLFAEGAAFSYQEVKTSIGSVIVGLGKEDALREFGVPQEAGENLWHYAGTRDFFVYFKPASLVSIQLYPRFSNVQVGSPLELKAYGYFSDFSTKDITDKVQILINRKWDFTFTKYGVAIPSRMGRYQALAKYENIFSNPCQIVVTEPIGEINEEDERCLAINLIPFSPTANPGTSLSFKSFGTFLSRVDNVYSVRDITRESQWFLEDDSGVSQSKDNSIQFGVRKGKARVFCRYKGLESFPQTVKLTDLPLSKRQVLTHITVLPEVASISTGSYITLKAFGTYENNDIRDVCKRARWRLINGDALVESGGRGEFFGAFEGICEVSAELEGVRSPSSKIAVKLPLLPNKEVSTAPVRDAPQDKRDEEKPSDARNLLKDIKTDTEKLVKDALGKEKKLKSIRIDPPSFKVAVGESVQAVAWGVYDDYSEEELTNLAEWKPVNTRLFSAEQGRISAYMAGESDLYVKFKGITSTAARVVIEGPRLTSIVVSPASSQISMLERVEFSAEGHFSDSSRKYITDMVDWVISGPRIIKMKKAVACPLKFGRTKIYAQYAQVKSLPSDIRVIFTWGWFILLVLNIFLFLCCLALAIFAVFYLLTGGERKRLKSLLEKDPRAFAVKIYGNAKDIIEIFGFRQEEVLPPLAYASLVDMKFTLNFYYRDALGLKKDASIEEIKKKYHDLALIYHPDKAKPGEAEESARKFKEINEAYLALSNPKSNRTFFNFTQRFEEAKYSKHSFERGEALAMLSEYNYFINVMLSHFNSRQFLPRYYMALLRRKPLRL